MTILGSKRISRHKTALMTSIGALAMSAGVSAQSSEPAKITYKDGKTSLQPTAYVPPSAPQAAILQGESSQSAKQDGFDVSRVDRRLYPHQKVGKPYKISGKTFTPEHQPDYDVSGEASWYGDKYHGQPTASGEIMNEDAYTAAHPTLPLNSLVHVTNMDNGKTLLVRINDRGPFSKDSLIDLSKGAAQELGMNLGSDASSVRVRYAGPAEPVTSDKTASAPTAIAPRAYQPLRQQAPSSAQAKAPEHVEPQPPESLPDNKSEGDDDEFVTLTIKGPIHMA